MINNKKYLFSFQQRFYSTKTLEKCLNDMVTKIVPTYHDFIIKYDGVPLKNMVGFVILNNDSHISVNFLVVGGSKKKDLRDWTSVDVDTTDHSLIHAKCDGLLELFNRFSGDVDGKLAKIMQMLEDHESDSEPEDLSIYKKNGKSVMQRQEILKEKTHFLVGTVDENIWYFMFYVNASNPQYNVGLVKPVTLEDILNLAMAYYSVPETSTFLANGNELPVVDDYVLTDVLGNFCTVDILIPILGGGKKKAPPKRRKRRKNRVQGPLKGNGDYSSSAKMLTNEIKKAINDGGKGLADRFGDSAGQWVSRKTGIDRGVTTTATKGVLNFLRKHLIGSGDYTNASSMKSNSLMIGDMPDNASFRDQGAIVDWVWKEYIGEVLAGGNNVFSYSNFLIDPSNFSSFTLLPLIAQLFDEWCMKAFVVLFVSSTSDYNAVGNLGTIILAFTDDPTAPTPATKVIMENTFDAISAKPSCSQTYGVECNEFKDRWFLVNRAVLNNGTTVNANPLATTTAGQYFVGVNNTTAFVQNSALGELWNTGHFWFRGPISPLMRPGYARFSYAFSSSGLHLWPTAALISSVCYGKGCPIAVSSAGIINFPNNDAGDDFTVVILWNQAASTILVGMGITTTNFTSQTLFTNYTVANFTTSTTTATSFITNYTSTTSGLSTLTITPPTAVGNTTGVIDIIVYPFANSLVGGTAAQPSL